MRFMLDQQHVMSWGNTSCLFNGLWIKQHDTCMDFKDIFRYKITMNLNDLCVVMGLCGYQTWHMCGFPRCFSCKWLTMDFYHHEVNRWLHFYGLFNIIGHTKKGKWMIWMKHPFEHWPWAHLNLGPLVHKSSVVTTGPFQPPLLLLNFLRIHSRIISVVPKLHWGLNLLTIFRVISSLCL